MAKTKGRIDITQIDESRLPKRNRVEDLQKIWYKFSLSKVSVVGLAIVMLVVLAAIFYNETLRDGFQKIVDFNLAPENRGW